MDCRLPKWYAVKHLRFVSISFEPAYSQDYRQEPLNFFNKKFFDPHQNFKENPFLHQHRSAQNFPNYWDICQSLIVNRRCPPPHTISGAILLSLCKAIEFLQLLHTICYNFIFSTFCLPPSIFPFFFFDNILFAETIIYNINFDFSNDTLNKNLTG